jgi:tetratricopeptide (TPR) repeat protein
MHQLNALILVVFGVALWLISPAHTEPNPDQDQMAIRRYLDNATKIASKLEKPEDSHRILTQVATMQMKTGLGATAPILAQALAAAGRIESAIPRILALRQVAAGYVICGDLESALEIADQGGNANESVLLAMVDAQLSTGDVEGAQKLAERLGGNARLNGLTRIAAAQAQKGDIRAALKIAKLVENSPLSRAQALQEIALAQAKAGRKDDALNSVEEALKLVESVVAPSGRSTVLGSLAICQAGIGDTAGGLRTLESGNVHEDIAYRGYVYWRFAVEQTKAGDAKGAIRFAETLSDARDQVGVLLQIAKTQAEQKKREDAQATVTLAEGRFKTIKDEKQKADLHASFATTHVRAGNRERGWEAAAMVKEPISRIFVYWEIAKVQIGADDRTSALATLKKAMAITDMLPANGPLSSTAIYGICEFLGQLDHDADAIALIDRCEPPSQKAMGWVGLAHGIANRTNKLKKIP